MPSKPEQVREKGCLIVQTTLALTVAVIGIKMGKLLFISLGDVGSHPFHTALRVTSEPPLIRIAVVIACTFLAAELLLPRWKWLVTALSVVVFSFYKVVQALLTGKPVRSYFAEQAAVELRQVMSAIRVAFSIIRMDVLFFTGFAIFVYAMVMLAPARHLRALRFLLALCSGLLLLVSGLELANYCKTGVAGTGQLLRFFVINASSLVHMLHTAIDFEAISALLAPFAIGLATAFLVEKWYARSERISFRLQVTLFPFLFVFGLTAGFVHPETRETTQSLFFRSTLVCLL